MNESTRNAVTSPGGTTASAIYELENGEFVWERVTRYRLLLLRNSQSYLLNRQVSNRYQGCNLGMLSKKFGDGRTKLAGGIT